MKLPEFSPQEILLRSLRKRDINKSSGRIKWNALRVSRGGDGKLSLVRQVIGDDEAKRCARVFVHADEFAAFGRAAHECLLRHCASIEDDPVPFVGHANMTLGYPTPPAPQDGNEVMTEAIALAQERLSRLSMEFEVVLDPDPPSAKWAGPFLGQPKQCEVQG